MAVFQRRDLFSGYKSQQKQRLVASGSPRNDSRLGWRQAFQEKSRSGFARCGYDLFSQWIPLPVAGLLTRWLVHVPRCTPCPIQNPFPSSRPITASSSPRLSWRIGRQAGQLPQEPWPMQKGRLRLSRPSERDWHRRTPTKGLPIKHVGKMSRNASMSMSMKVHWTIVDWCADHAHGEGFFGLWFTLEPIKKRSVRAWSM